MLDGTLFSTAGSDAAALTPAAGMCRDDLTLTLATDDANSEENGLLPAPAVQPHAGVHTATELTKPLPGSAASEDPSDPAFALHATAPASDQLCGERVSVFWGGDNKWYAGVITKLDEQRDFVTVLYDDGEVIDHTLSTAELQLGEPPLARAPPPAPRRKKKQVQPKAAKPRKPQPCSACGGMGHARRFCPYIEGYAAPNLVDEASDLAASRTARAVAAAKATLALYQGRIPDDPADLWPIRTDRTKSGYVGVYKARGNRWQAQANHCAIGGYASAWEAGVAVTAHLLAIVRGDDTVDIPDDASTSSVQQMQCTKRADCKLPTFSFTPHTHAIAPA